MRRSQNDSSLDLLLDTICNTFGGVLFISILVVVLLNMTSEEIASEPPTETAQERLLQLEQEMAATRSELTRLESAVAAQEAVEEQISDPDAKEIVQRLVSSQNARVRLEERKNDALREFGEDQASINEIAKKFAEDKAELERANKELAAVKQALNREVNKRIRTSELPKQRDTNKASAAFFLHNGRLYSYARLVAGGQLTLNSADCEERSDNVGKFIYLKPNGGTPVDAGGKNNDVVIKKLTAFSKDHYYVKIFISPDSFKHFSTVRDVLIDKQFEYKLAPLPDEEKVYLTSSAIKEKVQ